MLPDREELLDKKEFEKYGIPSKCTGYVFSIDKVIEERCDEFDYILEEDGHIIVDRDYEQAATSIFNYTVITYKES